MPAPRPKLDRKSAAVLLVDVQDRLTPAMPPETLARVVKYSRAMIQAGKALGLPVLATEQYPKGLGRTLPELRELLPEPPLEKVHFSCGADEAFAQRLASLGRKQVIVVGMETHVCADAVSSRTELHRQSGLDLCRQAGAVITNAETAIFDLLHRAATDEFRAVSPLVK
jgi:isochorismate hydrolase